jgi:hypothetical protein
MKRIALAAAAALLNAFAAAAHAQTVGQVEIVDRTTGQVLPVYTHQGRLYVAGTPGEKYAVRLSNRSGARTLNVVSVDGINAVTGETAAPDQNGYVLHAGQSFEVNGWRKSTSEVAAFYFARLPDSYAARTDRPDNVGVIGVAVFREWRPREVVRPAPSVAPQARERAAGADAAAAESAGRAAADAAGPAASPPPEAARRNEKIGTGHGERERSEVVYTQFRRAGSVADETIVIHYDTHANLVALGVIPREPRVVTPNPFPGRQFVPDPRG